MKRGSSGCSLVVGVDKPAGMSSHDVVNRCRSIFGERRVGHAGTLDPAATGVLPVLVGPATRLDAYLTGHDKRYRAQICFGVSTDTDDAQGRVLREGPVPPQLLDEDFAASFVAGLVGARKQMPPAYSAIKVEGKKSYEQARAGAIIDMSPRDIEVYEARLVGVLDPGPEGMPAWDVELHVSKGTYIRAIARDVGIDLGCPAHLGSLRRTAVGSLALDDCVGLDALAELKEGAALDPVALLGCRFSYADEAMTARLRNGAGFRREELALFELRRVPPEVEMGSCIPGAQASGEAPQDGELVAVVADNRLAALYCYDGESARYRARCVFQTGVSRGENL